MEIIEMFLNDPWLFALGFVMWLIIGCLFTATFIMEIDDE